MIPDTYISTLVAIARARVDHASVRAAILSQHWLMVEDEIDFGFLRADVPTSRKEHPGELVVQLHHMPRVPYSILTFCGYPDDTENMALLTADYSSLRAVLSNVLGVHGDGGADEQNQFTQWSTADVEFTLNRTVVDRSDREYDRDSAGYLIITVRP